MLWNQWKVFVTAHSLPALVLLDDRYTTHWQRILVSLNFHGSALSLWVGAIDPLGNEFGPPDANSERVFVQLPEMNLVGLQARVFPRKKELGYLSGPETDGKCKIPLRMLANVDKELMNMGAGPNGLEDKNGRLMRPSK